MARKESSKSSGPSPDKSKPAIHKKKPNHPSFPDRKQPQKQSISTQPRARATKKRKVYTDKELGIPQLNSIVPAGVQKPKRGKKKNKVFVDNDSMMTIMALVRAEKEGMIESQLAKARQLEEIRIARENERQAKAEKRQEEHQQVREDLRRGRRKPLKDLKDDRLETRPAARTSGKKRVSFAKAS